MEPRALLLLPELLKGLVRENLPFNADGCPNGVQRLTNI